MDNKEAIHILNYVLGRSAERKGSKMYDTGITLYPDIIRERQAVEMAIEALKLMDGYVPVKVVTAEYLVQESKAKKHHKTDPSDVKFGEF